MESMYSGEDAEAPHPVQEAAKTQADASEPDQSSENNFPWYLQPSDAEIIGVVQQCLGEVGLRRITRELLVAFAEQRFRAQLTAERRTFLNQQIDHQLRHPFFGTQVHPYPLSNQAFVASPQTQLFAQQFTTASANGFLPHGGTVLTPLEDLLAPMDTTSYEMTASGMAYTSMPPPTAPVTPSPYADYSSQPYKQNDAVAPDQWGFPLPADVTQETPSEMDPLPSGMPPTCSSCNMQFGGRYGPGNLKRHVKSVHGNEPYACEKEDCSRTYKRSDGRQAHYKKHHPELYVSR